MISSLFARCIGAFTVVAALSSPAFAETVQFGTSGAWQLFRTTEGGQVQACHATMFTDSGGGMMFDYNINETVIAFMAFGSAAPESMAETEVWFDNDRSTSQIVSMPLETDGSGQTWRVYRSPNDGPDPMHDLFSNLSTVHFNYYVPNIGENEAVFSLSGSNRMMSSIFECVVPNDHSPAPSEIAAPADSGFGRVIFGTCKLVVQGTTYIDLRGNCPIWLADDGSGTFWINTDRESYQGDYMAELMPSGDGFGSGHWNGEAGATHAQSFLGEDFQMASGGCWINATAMICAAQ